MEARKWECDSCESGKTITDDGTDASEHDEAEEMGMLQMAEAKLMQVYELLGIDPLQMDGVDLEENALEAAQFYASNTEGPVDLHRHRPTSRCAVPAKE